MLTLLAATLILMGLGLLALVIYQHWAGTHDLLSLRNIALSGFAIYQITSGAIALWKRDYSLFSIQDPEGAGLIFTVMVGIFLVVFLGAYNLGFPAKQLARATPTTPIDPSPTTLIVLAIALTIGSAILRFGVQLPYIGAIAGWIGTGYGAVAAGLVAWVWARNWTNPATMVLAGFITVANMGIAVSGQYGRRQLAAIAIAFAWGAFYAKIRYLPTVFMLQMIAIVGAPGVIAVALFTSVRSHGQEKDVASLATRMARGSITEGLTDILAGQGTGAAAMWCIENYPENFQGEPYQAITFVFTHNVPRALWPGKPEPLSIKIAGNADLEGVAIGKVTIPPGIVGYAAAEGGFPALVAYAVFFALFLRYFDDLVRKNPDSPLVVMPVACQLGQIIGLFRGDPSIFTNIYIYGFAGCYGTCIVLAKMIESRNAGQFGFLAAHGADEEGGDGPYDATEATVRADPPPPDNDWLWRGRPRDPAHARPRAPEPREADLRQRDDQWW